MSHALALGGTADAASMTPPVIDTAALKRLGELDPGGRAGLVTRLLRTYAESLQHLLAELRLARASADMAVLRRVAHTLKSSSASVGATAFSALCARAEAAAAGRGGELERLFDALEADSAGVAQAVRDLLAA
ncbi:MAG: Hpt domain-containing protein [Burkholderiaceae bacterium]